MMYSDEKYTYETENDYELERDCEFCLHYLGNGEGCTFDVCPYFED